MCLFQVIEEGVAKRSFCRQSCFRVVRQKLLQREVHLAASAVRRGRETIGEGGWIAKVGQDRQMTGSVFFSDQTMNQNHNLPIQVRRFSKQVSRHSDLDTHEALDEQFSIRVRF